MVGDILRVKRKAIGFIASFDNYKTEDSTLIDEVITRVGTYHHFGVQVSNNQVIHFVGSSYLTRKNSKIEITSLEGFSRNGEVTVVNSYQKKFSNDEIVKRAYSKLETDFGVYSVVENNCEHFATWCVTGKKKSNQSYLIEKSKYFFKFPLKSMKDIDENLILGQLFDVEVFNDEKFLGKIDKDKFKKIIKELPKKIENELNCVIKE